MADFPTDLTGVEIKRGCDLIWTGAKAGYLRQGRVLNVEADGLAWLVDIQDPRKTKPSIGTRAYGQRAYVLYTSLED